jgi:hypothetical protein
MGTSTPQGSWKSGRADSDFRLVRQFGSANLIAGTGTECWVRTQRSTQIVVSSMRFLGALVFAALLAGCGGKGDSAVRPTPVPTATPSASSAPASPSASPTGGQALHCGLFEHPIDPLPTPQAGEAQVAEGSGCGRGRVPSNGTFTVDTSANWILRFAYTCDGTFNGLGDAAVLFTLHNSSSGADSSPVIQPGPWGYGAGGLIGGLSGASPPVGSYVVLVAVANPDLHQCQWRAAVGRT